MTPEENLQKAIRGLECCLPMTTRDGLGNCMNCPYHRKITLESGVCDCCHDLMADALALLKAQEPKYPIRKQAKHGWFFYCPKCGRILNDMARPKYCSECGQAVKWE